MESKYTDIDDFAPTGILSDRDILDEMKDGHIIIDPFHPEQLSNCSYDVTLGEYYFRANPKVRIMNPWCEDHIKAFWGEVRIADIASDLDAKDLGLKSGDKYIELSPGELILAHTQEFIGGTTHITTMMKARSSVGRSCINVCDDAGAGDINYFNRWCMEIRNKSEHATLILPVGKRVAQIVFFYAGEPINPYHGNYQQETSLSDLKANWKPDDLLPKLYKERPPGSSLLRGLPGPTGVLEVMTKVQSEAV